MDLLYAPNTTTVGTVDFRPYMVEVAWNYCQLVLGSTLKRGMIEQTLAALAIEIVLKSYNAVVVDNVGELNETYQFQLPAGAKVSNKHNLVALAGLLRTDLRQFLIEPLDEAELEENQDAFSNSRYYYEASAPTSSSDSAMKLAIKLICKTLFLYKQRGCTDPFVTAFDVNAVYFTHVQRFAFVPAAT
ncbi:hypothetical protein [Rhodoferax sp. BLA1]|uniref:hypothetical protein n=1 Tax=Rhodoferax sp. BLA1 TaxID=2576062 RepID=UPI0015D25182|nr:hypothetical protein [Rhodoferax sp. BLA1]